MAQLLSIILLPRYLLNLTIYCLFVSIHDQHGHTHTQTHICDKKLDLSAHKATRSGSLKSKDEYFPVVVGGQPYGKGPAVSC